MINHYEILGVEKNASNDDIKLAYRKLAMKWHPDRNNNSVTAEEEFKKVKSAYEFLCDSYKRKELDWELSKAKNNSGNNNYRRYSTYNNQEFDSAFNQAFSEFFRQTHKSSSSQNSNKNSGKPQQTSTIKITFWESLFGCNKSLNLNLNGKGQPKTKVKITIPPGVSDKERFKLQIDNHDVKLTVNILEEPNIQRKNLDLFVNIEVPFTTAALGGHLIFAHWEGDINVQIPKGCRSGQAILIEGCGVRKNIFKGDLYLIANITVPKELSGSQEELLRLFQKTESSPNRIKDSLYATWKKYFK